MKSKTRKIFKILGWGLIVFVYLFAYIIICVNSWVKKTFNASIDEILFTFTNPLKGSNNHTLYNALEFCIPRILLFILLSVAVVFLLRYIGKKYYLKVETKKCTKTIKLSKILSNIAKISCVIFLSFTLIQTERQYLIIDYIRNQMSQTTIYEQYYVNPNDANIRLATSDGEKKNLIYIYLESMENTYASKDVGGSQNANYIPNLTTLANENISFSNSNKLGGFYNTNGSTWTMGAIMATSSGLPYSFPIGLNSMDRREKFASGITNLGDILEQQGYNQLFMCGSDAEFGGRALYFEQHGNYDIFDLYTAREENYIADDYHVWWGYEDEYLYKAAKDKITELSNNDEPFNLTMLTVDTHFLEGYVCELCQNQYGDACANIVSCADRQVYAFIEWCKTQEFFKDTVIVISGDHLRMDNCLVEGLTKNQRTIYNCFINSQISENINMKNRIFTPMDMFPSTLSALGYEWDGDRLGIGTNLFSNSQTLAEELGFEYLNSELSKRSNYYIDNFT